MKLRDRIIWRLVVEYAVFLVIGIVIGMWSCYSSAGELWLELGVGHDRHIDEGKNPMGTIRLRYEMQNSKWWMPDVLEFDHHSSVQNGFPFNKQPEDLADTASIVWRFRIK